MAGWRKDYIRVHVTFYGRRDDGLRQRSGRFADMRQLLKRTSAGCNPNIHGKKTSAAARLDR
jgi:hypothetical protein